VGLAKLAKVFEVPTILTTVLEARGGYLIKELQDVYPEQKPIDRTFINTWEDERVVAAVKDTGRTQLVLAGLYTERLQGRLNLEQPQLDRAIGAQQRATCEAEQQAVADLAGGTGDADLKGSCAHVRCALGEVGFGTKLQNNDFHLSNRYNALMFISSDRGGEGVE
jgi:hypothetical protein